MENNKELVKKNIDEKEKDFVKKNAIENSNPILIGSTNIDEISKKLDDFDKLAKIIKKCLIENEDYGIIPNCEKPSLFKSGAEKIALMYGLIANYEELPTNNPKLIKMKCVLFSPSLNRIMANSFGIAEVPKFGKDEGWKVNAAYKMCQKRAFVGAVVQIANLSKIFTQDMEDFDKKQANKDIDSNAKKNCINCVNALIKYLKDNNINYDWKVLKNDLILFAKENNKQFIGIYKFYEDNENLFKKDFVKYIKCDKYGLKNDEEEVNVDEALDNY